MSFVDESSFEDTLENEINTLREKLLKLEIEVANHSQMFANLKSQLDKYYFCIIEDKKL